LYNQLKIDLGSQNVQIDSVNQVSQAINNEISRVDGLQYSHEQKLNGLENELRDNILNLRKDFDIQSQKLESTQEQLSQEINKRIDSLEKKLHKFGLNDFIKILSSAIAGGIIGGLVIGHFGCGLPLMNRNTACTTQPSQ
jgi:archaellum component FlaC